MPYEQLTQFVSLSMHALMGLPVSRNTVGFPGGTVVKNLPANAGDARDEGSIPGCKR